MKILFSGGGTGGAIMPLFAIAEELQKKNIVQKKEDFFWLGTRFGIEKNMVVNEGIVFRGIFSGKFRRYFSVKNIFDPIFIVCGFFESLFWVFRFRPDVVVTVGGFVSVPVVWAAWILRKKILVHQQDVRIGLANKLMAPFANRITVTYQKSLHEFSKKKTVLTGNAVRRSLLEGNKVRGQEFFHLQSGLPVLLCMGGGTGAKNLNALVTSALSELTQFCEIIHLTGKGREVFVLETGTYFLKEHYHPYEFLVSEMKDALSIADLIVSRAGLSSLSEFSFLKKPTILIPIPRSHQEENADFFSVHNAAIVAREEELTKEYFIKLVKEIFADPIALQNLSDNIGKIMIQNGSENIAGEIIKLVSV